jgi:hypothetical protein
MCIYLSSKQESGKGYVPHVERARLWSNQLSTKFPITAKAYILYREERTQKRKAGFVQKVKELAAASKIFPCPLAELVATALFKPMSEEGRRET